MHQDMTCRHEPWQLLGASKYLFVNFCIKFNSINSHCVTRTTHTGLQVSRCVCNTRKIGKETSAVLVMMSFLAVLLLLIARRLTAISIVVEEVDLVSNASLGGAPPPVNNKITTTSCSCNKLLLSSLGVAASLDPKMMGIYSR